MSTKSLRESVELLKEFMYGGGAYPGPEPGKLAATAMSYSPAARAMMFPNLDSDEAEKKRFKDKAADKRAALRKLATWLQQKGER